MAESHQRNLLIALGVIVLISLVNQNVVLQMIAPTFSFAMVDRNGASQHHTFHHYYYDISRAVRWTLLNDKSRRPYVPGSLVYLKHPVIVGPSGFVKSVLSYLDRFCSVDNRPVNVGIVVSVRKPDDFCTYNCLRVARCRINPKDSFDKQALDLKHEIDKHKGRRRMSGIQLLATGVKCDICFNSWIHHGPEEFDAFQNESVPRVRSQRKRYVLLCKHSGEWYVRYSQDV